MTATAPASDLPREAGVDRRPLAWWASILIGIAAAAAGLLPWLVTGMRLPLQNLWDAQTAPESMPLALLPFSQYALTQLFGLIVVGSAAAGIAARATRSRLTRGGFGLLTLGVLAVQVVAIAQSALVVGAGLQQRRESLLYLGALTAVCVLSFLIGVAALLLIARAPRAGALIGLTAGAIAAGSWVGGFFQPLLATGSDGLYVIVGLIQWVAPVLVGVAIAWTGVNTVGRVVAAVVGLTLLWIAPAAMTGISNAAGSRVLARYPLEMIDYGVSVFGMALFMPEIALRPIVAAVVVAAVGLIARWAWGRARRERATAA